MTPSERSAAWFVLGSVVGFWVGVALFVLHILSVGP